MPLDRSIKNVLVIGSGPIVIGQGCEFDYSGTQSCKALKEEGCRVILINSNPATIMTDSYVADAIYIEPITLETIEKIVEKEKPDALLPIVGGQTALNCARDFRSLWEMFGIHLLGVSLETIERVEDRALFKEAMLKAGIDMPQSTCSSSFPLISRSSFSLGGQGGAVIKSEKQLEELGAHAFLEESLLGWKEFELELVRDQTGNTIVICGMENIDPMGIHTGDSVVVAPIQTLTDKEYQRMRMMAFQVMDAVGMRAGACNVQFAVHPKTGRMVCIEMNPRLSRSSALASKATGYPIARVATKLALGYCLDEISPFAFEPTLDYVVTKIPRFDFDRFPSLKPVLSIHMQSVGEAMGIGRTFKESLQKAIESLESDISGRLLSAFQGFRKGHLIAHVRDHTDYDPWFLAQIREIVKTEQQIEQYDIESVSKEQLYRWKQMGFSDCRLARLLRCNEKVICAQRNEFKIFPVYKRVDMCAGEFPCDTDYLYSTYEQECESRPSLKKKVLVLGSGPNRIGQGIEFDYCCVHAAQAIRKAGYESIMLNCNLETVSTDYDTADKLYFEPLSAEYVREVIRKEKPEGVIIQFGGQTALNIGRELDGHLLGTCLESIEKAEDRNKFRHIAKEIGLQQPKNASFSSIQEAWQQAERIGFPMILRPSYVIGGFAMQILHSRGEFAEYLRSVPLDQLSPILIEEFLTGAMEVEVDAVCDGAESMICGIIEHVDPVGVHSGDSACFLSPYRLSESVQDLLIEQTRAIGRALEIIGFFNVQFAVQDEEIFILEVNPRASRTVPLLSKTTGVQLVDIAIRCILGGKIDQHRIEPKFLGLKIPVFSFSKLRIPKQVLGPRMQSTGEVLCVGKSFEELFTKAQLYVRGYADVAFEDACAKYQS